MIFDHLQAAMTPLTDLIVHLSAETGVPFTSLQYLFCMFSAYPLAFMLRAIPSSIGRHIFGMVFGFLMGVWMLGDGIIHTFASSLVAYLVMRAMPGPLGTKIVCLWAFGYMAAGHMYSQYINYLTYMLDFTISQMTVTLKLCALAMNIQDGIAKTPLTAYQEESKVVPDKVPSLLSFYGYIFFFPTFLAGPFFEYGRYSAFINRSLFSTPDKSVPSGWGYAAIECMILAVILMVINLVGKQYFYAELFLDDDWVATHGLHQRILYAMVVCFVTRCQYYCVWKLVEAAVVVTGLGFNGHDDKGNSKWDGVRNVEIFKLETAQNLRYIVANWNMGTAKWLRYYCYERMVVRGSKPTAVTNLITYAVSAIWHGFYPGYYHFFIGYSVLTQTSAVMRARVRPIFLSYGADSLLKRLYDVVGIFLSLFVLDYLALAFILMANSYAMKVFASFYWSVHIAGVVILAADAVFKPRRPKREPGATTPKAAADGASTGTDSKKAD